MKLLGTASRGAVGNSKQDNSVERATSSEPVGNRIKGRRKGSGNTQWDILGRTKQQMSEKKHLGRQTEYVASSKLEYIASQITFPSAIFKIFKMTP